MSWPPARDNQEELTATPAIMEACHAYNQKNHFPTPKNPNATTQAERYASDYDLSEHSIARGRLEGFLEPTQKKKSLLLVDQCNTTLFKYGGGKYQMHPTVDPARRDLLTLMKDYHLEHKASIFGGKMNISRNDSNGSTVASHLPLSKVCDANRDKELPKDEVALTGMVAATIQQFTSRVLKKEPDCKVTLHDARYHYEWIRNNFHQKGLVAAAAFKDGITTEACDGIRANKIKGWDNDHAIAKNVLRMYRGTGKDDSVERPVDAKIIIEGINTISYFGEDGPYDPANFQIHPEVVSKIKSTVSFHMAERVLKILPAIFECYDLFGADCDNDPRTIGSRWKLLEERFNVMSETSKACKHALTDIVTARKFVKENVGNKSSRGWKKDKVLLSHDECEAKIISLLNDPSNPHNELWCRLDTKSPTIPPDGMKTFQPKYPIIESKVFLDFKRCSKPFKLKILTLPTRSGRKTRMLTRRILLYQMPTIWSIPSSNFQLLESRRPSSMVGGCVGS